MEYYAAKKMDEDALGIDRGRALKRMGRKEGGQHKCVAS